jgi:hypothetical protein
MRRRYPEGKERAIELNGPHPYPLSYSRQYPEEEERVLLLNGAEDPLLPPKAVRLELRTALEYSEEPGNESRLGSSRDVQNYLTKVDVDKSAAGFALCMNIQNVPNLTAEMGELRPDESSYRAITAAALLSGSAGVILAVRTGPYPSVAIGEEYLPLSDILSLLGLKLLDIVLFWRDWEATGTVSLLDHGAMAPK